uniref:Uncharacterized protein n=1 Tax=Avena sativa TaxID=4498 RepID=A0ACD5WW84_AVESA
MEKGSAGSDPAAKTLGVAVAGAGDSKEQTQETEETTQGMAYCDALYAEALRYIAMAEEDLVEEYWQAGKLRKYDRTKEWPKRAARIARVHPPPKCMEAEIAVYMKYLEEEEAQ